MNKMIERVALALMERNIAANGWGEEMAAQMRCDEEYVDRWRVLAVVAIEAMREPTDEMVWQAAATYRAPVDSTVGEICTDLYRAMIDTARSKTA